MEVARFTKCPARVLTKTKPLYFLSPTGEEFVQPKISAVQSAYITEKLTMTTTQNVTELQPRLTREQLIDATRKAAPLLPPAYREMMNELANRLDYTSVALCEAMAQRKEQSTHNATLREDVTSWARECDRLEERLTKTPTNMHLLEAQRELRELSAVVICLNNVSPRRKCE